MSDKIALVSAVICCASALLSIWSVSWQWGATAGLFFFVAIASYLYNDAGDGPRSM